MIFFRKVVKNAYRVFLNELSSLIGTKWAVMFDSRFRFGRKINLSNPQTLSDKILWVELYGDQQRSARLTDKYEVRSFVSAQGFSDTVIPLAGGPWTESSQIDFSLLPDKFVLKATHGCEMNYICKDRANLDEVAVRNLAAKWMDEDYSRACVEPHYKLIPHRLYAENYIGGFDSDIVDYKIHCINGEPKFILTCSNREKGLLLNLYSLDWVPIEGLQGDMVNPKAISKPSCLKEMIKIASCLSKGFDFMRVDLYEVEGKVLFGELTFTPAGGVLPYFTEEFLTYWGKEMHIEAISKEKLA